jgi:aspartate racemase
MNDMCCLGLVGGLGVGATIYYYERLSRALEAKSRALDIVIVHAQTSRVFEYVQADDRDGLAEYLCGFIRRLQAAGAEVAAIPAVTPHLCLPELVAISPLPIFNIFEPLIKELQFRKAQRIAILGARFVIESRLFGQAGTVEIIKPKPDEMEYIHNTYVELAKRGEGSEEQYRGLTALAHTFCNRDGADAIVLAGTDLALLFNESNTPFPYIDCAALHLQAILNGLIGETPLDSRQTV